MEIVMKKMETFCPRKEHLTMVAAAAGIAMVLAFWCLVWPVAGAQAGPLAALVVGTAVAYAVVGLGMIFLIALGLTMIPGKPWPRFFPMIFPPLCVPAIVTVQAAGQAAFLSLALRPFWMPCVMQGQFAEYTKKPENRLHHAEWRLYPLIRKKGCSILLFKHVSPSAYRFAPLKNLL